MQLEKAINIRSADKAKTFLASLPSDEQQKLNFDKVFLIYKLTSTKQLTLTNAMVSMQSLEQAKSYFNKLALQVHPDKNSHPLANTVFKKLRESFDEAKSTLHR